MRVCCAFLLLLLVVGGSSASIRSAPRHVTPSASLTDSLFAVIDRSNPVGSGLSQDQLSVLSQAARGSVASALGRRGYRVLSEESTVAILQDMGVDLAACDGECELQVARSLQADWLLSLRVVRFGEWWTLQTNLFRTSTGELLGGETEDCERQRDLRRTLQESVRRLCAGLLGQDQDVSDPGVVDFGDELPRESESGIQDETDPDPPAAATPETKPVHQRSYEPSRAGIRNRFCLEGGYGPTFFTPRSEWDSVISVDSRSWGAGLRMADPSHSLFDVTLEWWCAQEQLSQGSNSWQQQYSLLRGGLEFTPIHLGQVHPFGRLAYQFVRTSSYVPESRRVIGGAGLEYRSRGGLALAAALELQYDATPGAGMSLIERFYRTEMAWSGSNFGLGVEVLLSDQSGMDPAYSARLRIY